MFFAEVNIIYIVDLKISSFYIFRTVKLPAVQKAVVGMYHGRGTHGRGTAGHGCRSSSRTYQSVEKVDVKDEPLSSEPVTITEEEDEDETIIKIIQNLDIKKGRVPKARRGKPFTASAGAEREIRKCSVEIVREDIQKGVKNVTIKRRSQRLWKKRKKTNQRLWLKRNKVNKKLWKKKHRMNQRLQQKRNKVKK